MKVVLALSTALLAIGAANGGQGMAVDVYRYTAKSTSAFFSANNYDGCVSEGLGVSAYNNVGRDGAAGTGNVGYFYKYSYDYCNWQFYFDWVEFGLPEGALRANPNAGATLDFDGEGRSCKWDPELYDFVCVPVPVSLHVTWTPTGEVERYASSSCYKQESNQFGNIRVSSKYRGTWTQATTTYTGSVYGVPLPAPGEFTSLYGQISSNSYGELRIERGY
jgi:hypothetical protein